MSLWIDAIAIAAQTKMLQRMQAGKRVAIVTGHFRRIRYVCLPEYHLRDGSSDRADVEYFYLPKAGYMRNKSIESRANINVPTWLGLEYFLCHKQILPKIIAFSDATLLFPVMQTGQEAHPSGILFSEE